MPDVFHLFMLFQRLIYMQILFYPFFDFKIIKNQHKISISSARSMNAVQIIFVFLVNNIYV